MNFSVLNVLIFSFFFVTASAQAYIPPTPFILKTWAAKHTGPKSIKFKVTVSNQTVSFKETVWIDFQKRSIKSKAISDDGKELYALERGFSDLKNPLPLAKALLLESNPEIVSKALWDVGVSDLAWLGRWKGKIAWVVGEKAKDSLLTPQLWIEKDLFLPLKLVLKQAESSVEIRFENYHFYKEFPFPQSISVVKLLGDPSRVQETVLLKAESSDFTINPDFPSTKDVSADFQHVSADQYQELIQNYHLWLR